MDWIRDQPLRPLLKWPGGKSNELRMLRANHPALFPAKVERYFEPFLGGGAVWLAVDSGCPKFVNDICTDLMDFYACIRSRDRGFFQAISRMATDWDLLHKYAQTNWRRLYTDSSDVDTRVLGFQAVDRSCHQTLSQTFARKMKRVKLVEMRNGVGLDKEGRKSNIESALKAGYYTHIRDVFNQSSWPSQRTAAFYFLRDFCFSSMFRYNSSGEFNVPYGGISYNSRSPAFRLDYWKSYTLLKHLKTTTFDNMDFEAFLDQHRPTVRDFAFIDPPYDTEFSTYDKKVFDLREQERLATYLSRSKMQFIAVMKYTPRIYKLYQAVRNVRLLPLNKNFAANFRSRHDRDVKLLVITRVNVT